MQVLIKSALLFGAICSISSNAYSQNSDVESVKQVIVTLFDGMRAADSSIVASTFVSDAIMHSVYTNREGEVVRNVGSLEGFLTSIATPRSEILDERIGSYNINIDGDLASVWTPYQFYVGENFSHCGVNSFQMMRKNDEWKIIYIVDTRRRSDCIE